VKISDKKPDIKLSTQVEVSEIFSSLQGEGLYLGKKQVFVRFGRCNMKCVYCDEVDKMSKGAFKQVTVSSIISRILHFENIYGTHHSVSLTGGEPLMYPKALAALLPLLKERGLRVYLETNGTYPQNLNQFLSYMDIIAMDMKPPSSSGDRPFWEEHEDFLRLGAQKKIFVKIVITSKTLLHEISRCVDIMRRVNPAIPLIFQPESEWTGISIEAMDKIRLEYEPLASQRLQDVRVIPQMHKIWGIQ